LSANQDFPEKWRSKGEYGEIDVYSKNAVNDWFKRCIDDFPIYPVIGRGESWTHREYEAWFKKWFGRFIFVPSKQSEDGSYETEWDEERGKYR